MIILYNNAKLYTPKVGSKGLMTLPKEIRNILGIKEGDRLLLKVENDGKIIIEKAMLVPVQIEKERVNEHAQ